MNVLLYRHLHRISDWHRSKMAEAVEDRTRITWVLEVSFLVWREASVSGRSDPSTAEATSGKAESFWRESIRLRPHESGYF